MQHWTKSYNSSFPLLYTYHTLYVSHLHVILNISFQTWGGNGTLKTWHVNSVIIRYRNRKKIYWNFSSLKVTNFYVVLWAKGELPIDKIRIPQSPFITKKQNKKNIPFTSAESYNYCWTPQKPSLGRLILIYVPT